MFLSFIVLSVFHGLMMHVYLLVNFFEFSGTNILKLPVKRFRNYQEIKNPTPSCKADLK